MSSLLQQKLALLPRRSSESLTDYSDRLVFDQYMRHGDIAPEIKTFQKLTYQLAALQALKAELRAYRKKLGLKYDPEEARVPAGEPDGGQWTNDGDNDADDGGGNAVSALDDVIKKLEKTADFNGTSKGQCARAVREALREGGIEVIPPAPQPGNRLPSAADYGPSFENAGANIVATVDRIGGPAIYPPRNYTPSKGDIIVFDRFPGHPDGHTAMYNGNQWISDFRQKTPWPNQPLAQAYGPSYKIYRFSQFNN